MIKQLLIIPTVALSLSSCALYDAYFMAKFDANEYQYIAAIRTHAQIGAQKCGTPAVNSEVNYVYTATKEFKNYSEKIPHNEDAHKLATSLNEITSGLYAKYAEDKPPSAVYCKSKFSAIERTSEKIQTVLGDKPR